MVVRLIRAQHSSLAAWVAVTEFCLWVPARIAVSRSAIHLDGPNKGNDID